MSPQILPPESDEILPSMRAYLTWADWQRAWTLATREGLTAQHGLYASPEQLQAIWYRIVDQALADWTRKFPGTRPKSWWEWSAPELRRLQGGVYHLIDGAGRCHPTGVPYIGDWEAHPPRVESTPAYLDRLELWLPRERARVPTSAFASQPFSYDLTVHVHDADDNSPIDPAA
jgi:hypothetical protein